MFSKANKQGQSTSALDHSSKPASKASVPSIISPDLRINGDMVCSGDIQIDGWVEGDIQSRNVTVGEGATVHGAVQAENVKICGIINGQIRADNVVLEKTARVTGDILHKSLSIEQGAFLEGMCKRIDSSPGAAVSLENKNLLAKPLGAPKDRVIGLGNTEPLVPTDKAVVN
jgi:cytoskeletal protein CcmA (bactofilin family)